MTEYATTPSAIEEWNAQRSRTAKWVNDIAPSGTCYPPSRSPSQDSDFEKRSLWDGSGWDIPSDCESSTSVPPTMMLKYADSHQVLVTPSQSDGSKMRSDGNKTRGRRTTDKGIGNVDGTIRSRSHTVAPTPKASTRHSTQAASAHLPREQPVGSHSDARIVPGPTIQGSKRSSVRAPQPPSIHSQQEHVSDPSSSVTHVRSPSPISPSHHSQSHIPPQTRSRSRSHSASHPASQIRSQPSRPPASHIQSHHPSAALPSHTTSHAVASSRHASEAPPVIHEPPPISSIHSRSISHSDSRSSGPPEAITIHPPTASGSARSVSGAQIPYPHTVATSQSVPAAANVALPPPTAESASLSYRSIRSRQEPREPVYIQPSVESSRASRRHQDAPPPPRLQTKGVQVDLAAPQHVLPTPVSMDEPRYTVFPGRAMSNMSTTGLDGGYVLIDGEGAPEERYRTPKKGSFGSRSGHERGSLLNVFAGAGSRFGHSRSRSASQSNVPTDVAAMASSPYVTRA